MFGVHVLEHHTALNKGLCTISEGQDWDQYRYLLDFNVIESAYSGCDRNDLSVVSTFMIDYGLASWSM